MKKKSGKYVPLNDMQEIYFFQKSGIERRTTSREPPGSKLELNASEEVTKLKQRSYKRTVQEWRPPPSPRRFWIDISTPGDFVGYCGRIREIAHLRTILRNIEMYEILVE